MMDSLLKRIEKNRKAHIRWLAMVLCLSMIVSLGTFAGFHQTAVAKTYTKEVLDCPYTHEGAEPVAHVHNDDCYDGQTLVCTLPEREAHTHTDECFAEQRRLTCGLEENPGHQHGDACYAAREVNVCGLEENPGHVHNGTCFNDSGVLICTMAEGDGAHTHTADCFTTVYDLICEIPEGEGAHTHTEECYTTERVQVCGKAELPVHVHGAECIRTVEWTEGDEEPAAADEQTLNTVPEMPVSDPNADLETAEDWNREFENFELSGNWARDLVLVAATQQGRSESPNNFEAVLNDAGDAWVRHGYTRYGAWYGVPYAEEWSAMFVSFCLRYAGIPAENVPNNPTAALMAESFSKGELFAGRDYVPAVGDLIFFGTVNDEITNIDHMGIVYHVDAENGTINTVEGDRTDAVATFGYTLDDEQIVGYGILPQNPDYVPTEEENNGDETDGLIVMTMDEDKEETTDTTEAIVPAAPMPAQSWERTAGGIKVTVDAPEGAFPENTTIAVTPVNGNSLKDTVSDAVSGEVLEVQAVDITFFDADGHEIEPAIPIRVSMTPAATQHAEEKTSVVHVDVAQQTAELVEQAVGTEFDNSEVVFDADAFTIYAIVYTVDYEYEVDGQVYQYSMQGGSSMNLSKLIEILRVNQTSYTTSEFMEQIAEVAFSNPSLVQVVKIEGDWILNSLQAFDTQETLTVTMLDGQQFVVQVTDAQGDPLDGALSNVTITGAYSDSGTAWEVQKDQNYSLKFHFEEVAGNADKQINVDGDEIYLTLPDGFSALNIEPKPLNVSENGVALTGNTYSVRDGKLYLNLTDDTKNRIKTGNARFDVDISGSFTRSVDKMEFSSTISRSVTVREDHDLEIQKTASYQEWDHRIAYTVKVKSTGYNTNVRITDAITGSGVTLDDGAGYGLNVSGNSGTQTTTINTDKKGFQTILSSMNDGEEVTIKYYGKLDNSINGAEPSAQLTGNTVTGNTGTIEKTTEAYLDNKISWKNVTKEGGQSSGEGTEKTLPWTITLNAAKSDDLSGATVRDHIQSDNMVYDTSTDLTVTVYQANPNDVWNDIVYNTLTVKWSQVTLSEDDKTFTYTLPSDAGNYKYVISYNTKVTVPSDSIGNTTVKNDVTVEKNGKTETNEGEGKVGPANDIDLKKSVVNSDAETAEWKISFRVPKEGLSKAIVTDSLPNKWLDDGTYYDTLDETYEIAVREVINGEEEALGKGDHFNVDTSDPTKVKVTFTKGDGTPGLSGDENVEREIVVYLRTKFNPTWLERNFSDEHLNTVNINGEVQAGTKVKPTEGPSFDKTSASIGKIRIDGTDYPIYKYTLTINGLTEDNLTIEDDFDDALTYFDIYSQYSSVGDQYQGLGISYQWDETFYATSGDTQQYRTFPSTFTGNLDWNFKGYYTVNTGTDGKVTFTVDTQKLPRKHGTSALYESYTFTYFLIAQDLDALNSRSAEAGRALVLNNTATWKRDHELTDSATVEYQFPALEKTMIGLGPDADNGTIDRGSFPPSQAFAKFQIVVNPERAALPLDPEKQKVKLTDDFTNLSVDYTTVKIMREETDGALNDVTASTEHNYSGYTGTFYLDNQTKYIITYKARVVGEGGVSFHNIAKISDFKSVVEDKATITSSGSGEIKNYRVRLLKQAGDTMNELVQGAEYTLVDAAGNPILRPTTAKTIANGKAGTEITFTTNSNGIAEIFLSEDDDGISLQEGIKYYLKETKAPPLYQLSKSIYNFTISEHPNYNNTQNYEYYNNDIIKVRDRLKEGVLEINKGVTVDGSDVSGSLTIEQKKNIVFTISAELADGTEFKPLTVSYAEFTGGKYRLENLKPGIYTVTETKYELDKLHHESTTVSSEDTSSGASVSPADYTYTFVIPTENSSVPEHVVSYTNTYTSTPFTLNIQKVGAYNLKLYGAEFLLEVKEGDQYVPVVNSALDDKGKLTIPYEAQNSGVTIFSLADGEYRLTETKAPNGYRATAGEFIFTVADGKVTNKQHGNLIAYTANPDNDTSGTVVITNTIEYGYTLTKAEAGAVTTRLPGAKFAVYQFDTTKEDRKGNLIETRETDEEGQIEILKTDNSAYVDDQLYFIVEEEAPEGYQLNTKRFYFYWGTVDQGILSNYDSNAKAVNLGSAQVYSLVEDEPKTVNLVVKKTWQGNIPEGVTSIDFVVMRTEKTPGKDPVTKRYPDDKTVFTLSKGKYDTDTEWKQVTNADLLKNLPVGRSEDGVHTAYTYTVEELSTFEGMESVVNYLSDHNGEQYTIVNRPETTEINIEKIWADNLDHSTGNVTVKLYRKNSQGTDTGFSIQSSSYEVKGAINKWGANPGYIQFGSPWKVNITGLEKFKDDPADPWIYYVEEDTQSGYEAPIISAPISGDGTITVINPKKTTGIAVKKLWDGIEAENMPESVTVQLMKAGDIEDPDAATVTYYVYNTNWSDNATRHRVTVKNGSSLSVSYNGFAGECRITQGTGNCETPTYANNKWTIGNITGNIEIGFTTGWGYDQFDRVKSIEYVSGISPDKSTGTPVEGKTLTLNGSTNWYGEWTGLEDGFYYVVETAVGGVELADSGYEVTYSDNNSGIKTGTITMTNTRAELGTLKVKKEVKMTSSISADSTVFENWNFQIAVKDANGNYYNTNGEVVTGDAKWQTFAYNEEKAWSNLPLGTYTVEENQESASHAPAYALTTAIKVGDQQTSEVQVTAENNSADTATLVTVENAYTRETVSVEVQKVWVDNNNSANIRPSELWVRLMEGNNQATRVDLATYSDWHFKQDDLPKYHSNGSPYNYQWVEESVPEGYVLTSTTTEETTSGIITTITNTLKGALKLTKAVTVNDEAPTDANKGMTNGTYEFTVDGVPETATAGYKQTVEITFEDGKAISYKIGSGEAQTVTGTDNTWSVVIPYLTAGDYTITEIEPTNGTTLAGIVRGDQSSSSAGNDQQNSNEGEQGNEAAQNPVDLENQKVTVHVTTGDTTAAQGDAQATFTNNTDEGYLKVHKQVTYNGSAPTTAAQKQVLTGTYTFKVYKDENCQHAVMDGNTEKTLTVTILGDGTAQDSNTIQLPAGKYWLKEIIGDDSYVLPVGKNPQQIEITAENTTTAPKTVDVTNDYEFNEEDDNIAVDIVKHFTGLSSADKIPEGFKAVLKYKNGTEDVSVDLGNSSYVTASSVQVKVEKSSDGLTWTWHVYNIPKGSTGFSIHEVNYDKTGYKVEVYLDGKLVQEPGTGQSLNLDAPKAIMTEVPKNRITSETELNTYYVGSDYVLLVSINPRGTLVISDKSLNFLIRAAIVNAVKNGDVQGSFSEPVKFFSTEQHPAKIRIDSKRTITVSTDTSGHQTVYLPPETNSQATGFYVTYNSQPAYNNAEIRNDYTPEGVDIDIIKIAQGSSPVQYLDGATFNLRQIANEEPTASGTYKDATDAVKDEKNTNNGGKLTFKGLVHGYYELTETKAPIGYVLTGDSTVYFKVDDDGVTWLQKGDGAPSTWGMASNNDLVKFTAEADNPETTEDESANATFKIGNTPGTQLPQTGGIGTTLFTALGGLMTATAGAILTMKTYRRRKENA